MFSRLAGLAASVVLLAATATGAAAQSDDGKLVQIARKNVSLSSGSETIDLGDVKGTFKAIRLSNDGEAIEVESVRVNYGDGSVHNERRSFRLKRGERTRPIDPRKGGKFVDSIIINYKAASRSRDPAKITVWGLQDRAGAKATRDGREAAPKTAQSAPAAKDEVRTVKSSSRGRCIGEGNLLLGSANVALGVDRDVIRVGSRIGKFKQIRLCVSDNDIALLGVKVLFADGTSADLPYGGLIKAGYRTEGLDLKADQFIDRIELLYKKREQLTGTAAVEVWGKVSEKWLDEEGRLYNEGWVKLSSGNTAGFIGFDVDRTEVASHKKGVEMVRVVVKNRAITLDYVTLTYADGREQKFDAKRVKVEPEHGYGPLDIVGSRKVIKAIEARYRSRFFDTQAKGRENAVVEFWAR